MSENGRVEELERKVALLQRELVELRLGVASSQDALINQLLHDRTVLDNLPDIVCIVDRQHKILYMNRTIPTRTVREVVGTSALDYVALEHQAQYCEMFERAWQTGLPHSYEVHTLSNHFWESRFVPVRVQGEVVCMLITSADATARRLAEQAVRESEGRLRLALDATGMGTWSWSAQTDTLDWDEVICRMFGIEPAQAPKNLVEFFQLVAADDRARVQEAVRLAVASGEFPALEYRVELPNGELRHLLSKGTSTRNAAGMLTSFRGGVLDVTAKKRLEEQLHLVQKMEAIGQLTAGIAHNFNNLLSVILPNVSLARVTQGDEQALCLDDIEQAGLRAADMIQQLMLFARSGRLATRERIDLGELAGRIAQICRGTFDRGIEISLSVQPNIPCVAGNAGQIEQVLLNICLNARDALAGAHTAHPRIGVDVAADGGWVRMRIEDNGPGMDEATRLRVFEPFFTTKEVGRGTGLGLASVYAIVREHGGRISCMSEPGVGTVFAVELPLLAATEPSAAVSTRRPRGVAPRGHETILLIDDEPLVRRACAAMLAQGGYRVLQADGGASGLEQFQRAGAQIGAIVLDRSMPGMSGEQVAQRLLEFDPGVPIVMLSGQPSMTPSAAGIAAELAKPVDLSTLLHTLRYAIDRRSQR